MNIMHLRSSGGFFGAEGVILALSKKLKDLGCDNHIVCIDNAKNSHVELVCNAMGNGISAKAVTCKGIFDIKTIKKIRALIKECKIDIVHCHDYKADLYGFIASLFLKIKLVATNHLWTKESRSLRFYEFLDALLLNFFDRIVAVSDDVAKDLKERMLFGSSKITTIYNGINLSAYPANVTGEKVRKELNIKPKEKVIGSAGRLSPQKCYGDLIEAARMVIDAMPESVFIIAGEGPLESSLKEKAEKLGIGKKVIFTGSRTDMVDLYAAMDLFTLASLREGIPLVVLEAMAMKKPVIATKVGGVPTVIESGRNGILVEPKNPSILSEAIIRILKDDNLAKDLAKNGRRTVEDSFSAEKMAQKYKKVYEEVITVR